MTSFDSLSHRSREFISEDMIRQRQIADWAPIALFLRLGPLFTHRVINQFRRLNPRVQSPGWLWYFILGPQPELMGLRQYSFCQCSPLSCLVAVHHLKKKKKSISAHSARARDKISYQTDIKPTAPPNTPSQAKPPTRPAAAAATSDLRSAALREFLPKTSAWEQ